MLALKIQNIKIQIKYVNNWSLEYEKGHHKV